MRIRMKVLIGGTVLALLLGVAVPLVVADESANASVRLVVENLRELRVAISSQSIDIVPGQRDLIVVTGTLSSSPPGRAEEHGTIRIESPSDGVYVLRSATGSPGRTRGNLTIEVPPLFRLVIGSGSNVRVSSRVTELVSSGHSRSTLLVERGTGLHHVEIDAFGGSVELRTPELRTARVNGLETSVLLIAGQPEFLDVTTMTGTLNIHVDNLVTGVHRFATSSGRIDFHVDEWLDGTLTMQTAEGRVAAPGFDFLDTDSVAAWYLIYENGSARVNLRSFSGDVRIRVTTGQEYRLPHEVE